MTSSTLRAVLLACLVISSAVHGAIPAIARATDDGILAQSLILGIVTEVIDATTFAIESGSLVETDEATELVGFSAVLELRAGDLVTAEGQWHENVLAATRVSLVTAAAPAAAIDGLIALLQPPDGLVLDDGTLALVDDATDYVGVGGYGDLRVGDWVRLEGRIDEWSWTIEVERLELVTAGGPVFVAFEGLVEQVQPPDVILLGSGARLLVAQTTALAGFTSIEQLVAGDALWIEAWSGEEAGTFAAVSLTLLETDSQFVAFVSQVVSVTPPDRFTTADGHVVVVGPLTLLVGLSTVGDLQPGATVTVIGAVGTSPLEVLADTVILSSGEDDGNGSSGGGAGLESTLVGTIDALLPPATFVLGGQHTITVDEETAWLGTLTGYGDLAEGMITMVDATWQADGALVARTVENLGEVLTAALTLAGTIVDSSTDDRFQIATGEWISIDAFTVLDGDVDTVGEIVSGMHLSADAVLLWDNEYLAITAFVTYAVTDQSPWSSPMVSDISEALVVLADGADAWEVAQRHGAAVMGTLPGLLVHLFAWEEPISAVDVEAMVSDPEIEDVGPNYPFEDPESIRRRVIVIDRSPSSDKYADQQAAKAVGLSEAHERTLGDGTLVAVLDTGVDPFHPLLRHRIAPGGLDLVDGNETPWETSDGLDQDGDGDVDEAAGHGTFVAGIVLLTAPEATILPYRVLDDDGHGSTFAICQAVMSAMDRGADVINMSFAYSERPRVLDRLLDEASRRGIVLVSGAGNSSATDLPFPASDHRVIAVAAVDGDGRVADFSNFGAGVSIAAPGVDLYSGGIDGEFGTWSGTSMAAPLVSGTAALLRSLNPRLTPGMILDAIDQSAAAPPSGSDVPGLLRAAAALALVPGDG